MRRSARIERSGNVASLTFWRSRGDQRMGILDRFFGRRSAAAPAPADDIEGPHALVVERPGGLIVTKIDGLPKRWSVPTSEPVLRPTQPQALDGQPMAQQLAASQPQRSGEPSVTRHVKTEHNREEPM
jgi:hypothetical protein